MSRNIICSKTCLDGTTHEQVGSKGKERKKASNDNLYSHLKKENNNCSVAYLQKQNCSRQGKDHLFWLFEDFHKTVTLYMHHDTVFSHKPNIQC